MKSILKLEEAAMFGLPLFFFYKLDLPTWWFWVFLLAPDIGLIGYLINSKVGAVSYNLFHHKAVAVIVFIFGYMTSSVGFQFAGIILFAHSSMDRIFGYGLKYFDSFHNTHLGMIGKREKEPV